ncbi:MAG: hypothetical protein JF564_05085 [Sphingomonas sp.]|nr:hypothetical protein [Sphingomonas sp.]
MAIQDFDRSWLQDYLSRRLGKAVQVTDFTRFSRGTSRQTWFADYLVCDESKVRKITLRSDHPAGAGDPTPLDQEYFIYERLGRTELPVAAALWWEDDPAKTPRPFYIRNQIEGSWNIPGFADPDPRYDIVRLEASKEHIRRLAQIHLVDWKAHGFDQMLPAPRDTQDAGPAFLRLMLDKGTNGLGEEVFRDGRIVALSDWEEVIIGDPASDLAMVQGFTEAIVHDGETWWDLDTALAFYRAESGIDVTMENIRYYQLARLFGRGVMFAHTATVVAGTPTSTIRQSWTVTEVIHVVKRALGSALGWFEPVPGARFEEMNLSVEMEEQGQ